MKASAVRKSLPSIALTDEGFRVKAEEAYAVAWANIQEIVAFKLDLLTTDEVRFRFTLRDGGTFDVSEDQPGFRDFITAVQLQFPTVTGWEQSVIKPAFTRNETVLYRAS